MSDDRTPPKGSDGTKPGQKPAAPVTPASQGTKGTSPAPAPSSSKPTPPAQGGNSPAATKPPAAAGQQTAKPTQAAAASSPSTAKPAPNSGTAPKTAAPQPKSATPLVRSGTAPQPVVPPSGVAAGTAAKPGTSAPFRAQPKSSSVSGPPTEAFDPIADDRPSSPGAPAPSAVPTRPVGPRRARLLVSRLDPWSVMKTAFMLAVALAIVMLVATAVLWYALNAIGVFDAIGKVVNDLAGSGSTNFNFASLVGFGRVMGVALIIAALEIVLTSALSTLYAFLYNLSVGLTGGVEVTLSEES